MKKFRTGVILASCAIIAAPLAGCATNDPCSPFTTCEGAVNLILNAFTGDDFKQLCEEWNALSRSEQLSMAQEIAESPNALGDIREIGFFINPEAAMAGIMEAYIARLERDCPTA